MADICNDTGIMEIQTRSFRTLRKKLESFLDGFPVTVVYPVPAVKWLCWIDDETIGSLQSEKAAPGHRVRHHSRAVSDQESFASKTALRFQIVLLELTEYRHLNGWSRDKKKGSSRCDRIPERIIEEICLDTPADYLRFLPDGLPQVFTSAQAAEKPE